MKIRKALTETSIRNPLVVDKKSAMDAQKRRVRRMRRTDAHLSLGLSLLFTLFFGGAATLFAQKEPDLGTEAQREAGRVLYMEKCAQCHGENGDGNGIAKPFFKPEPRDFTSAIFKFRSTASGELPTDADMKRSIREGMPYTGMPAWQDLSNEQVQNLVYHLKTFSDFFSGPYGVVEPIEIPDPPSYSEESAQKGRKVYEENQCLDCHGQYGRGDGKSAPTLTDQWEQHIKPADLTKRWTFRNGQTRKDIYRTFTTGLDGTPMPSYSMEEEKRWQLVDYVYSLSRDEPDYGTMMTAYKIEREIDLSEGKSLFRGADSSLFPVVGQVIQPGRDFFPGVNAVQAKAVYNQNDIAIMLSWHTMTADTMGENSPAIKAARFDAQMKEKAGGDTLEAKYSDAAAIQIPGEMPEGTAKPYFLFGDADSPVDIWFVDLAKKMPELFVGRGSGEIIKLESDLEVMTDYRHGEWTVIFKRKRSRVEGLSFESGSFIPIAFSVWDGFNHEHGNKRGVTSWYYLYLEPEQTESPLAPMAKYGLVTLVLELGVVFIVRKKYGRMLSEVTG